MPQAYIVEAVRTAGGKRGGRLAGVHPVDLAAVSLDALVERSGIDPAAIDDVVMGCACAGAAIATNPAPASSAARTANVETFMIEIP